jgi:hypothetical protein
MAAAALPTGRSSHKRDLPVVSTGANMRLTIIDDRPLACAGSPRRNAG